MGTITYYDARRIRHNMPAPAYAILTRVVPLDPPDAKSRRLEFQFAMKTADEKSPSESLQRMRRELEDFDSWSYIAGWQDHCGDFGSPHPYGKYVVTQVDGILQFRSADFHAAMESIARMASGDPESSISFTAASAADLAVKKIVAAASGGRKK